MTKAGNASSSSFLRRDLPIILKLIRRNPFYIFASGFLAFYMLFSVAATIYPPLTGYAPFAINLNAALRAPSWGHLFGTDNLGRDIFTKVLDGAPIDAAVALAVVLSALAIGLLTGTVAGFFGGRVDEVIMRVTDIFLAFPSLVLALAIATGLGPGTTHAIMALIIVWWPVYTRLARGETLSVSSHQYITASRASGLSRIRIVTMHVIPNVMPPMLAYATADMGSAIINFATLGFLGLGAQPPLVDIGRIVYDGTTYLQVAPWYAILPAAMIFLIVISFALVGDLVHDYLGASIQM